MRKKILLLFFTLLSFSAIHAEINWALSDDGTLKISGTGDMPDYFLRVPWYNDRNKIKKVVVEDGVTSIGSCAFRDCKSLTSVIIPNSVTRIGDEVFYYCSSLTSITIPNSVTSIGSCAFKYCKGLTSITIPNSVTWLGIGAFEECTSLTSVTLSNNDDYIGADAFYNCYSLTSITIPNSVTGIGNYAFYNCYSLTSITIPNSVREICEYAFCDCPHLTYIRCESVTPPACYEGCFNNIRESIPVYVPSNSIKAYKEANIWKDFTNIQAIPTISLIDGEKYTNNLLFNVIDISYTRTFNSTKWQALYIPFSLSYSDWKDDFDVAYINGIRQIDTNDDNVIDETIMDVYRIEEGSLIPNTPYLIRAKTTGEKTISVSNTALYPAKGNSIDCSTTTARYTFTGTYETIPASTLIENEYYAMGGGSVIMTDGESDLKPYRWYLKIEARSPIYNIANTSNTAKAITINVIDEEGEATGISQMPQNDKTVSRIYDLNGRAINENALRPGMYIRNGKKFVIK